MVGSQPANAGDAGSGPGLGGSRVSWSGWAPWATIAGPARLGPVLPTGEAAVVRGPRAAMEGGPRLPRLQRALAQRRGPNTAIKLKKKTTKKNALY